MAQIQDVAAAVDEEKMVGIIEDNFGIDIDHWVVMNMYGVIDIVDAVEGIEIDITQLSINESAEHMMDMLSLTWQQVTQTGAQKLTGVQTAGYFVDTMTQTDDWAKEEETYFREHHTNIINGIIGSVRALGLTSEDLAVIAANVSDNYSTSIDEQEWQAIAETAIYCIQNDAQFLHIPQDIEVIEIELPYGKGMALGMDMYADKAAVQAFVSEQG